MYKRIILIISLLIIFIAVIGVLFYVKYNNSKIKKDDISSSKNVDLEIVLYPNVAPELDKDEDWLTDEEELKYKTDTNKSDTDGDGLLDGIEIDLGTDPVNKDSDNDGILDGEEYEWALNSTQ